MNPYPAPQSVLVLDNCQIHHIEGVEELCEQWYFMIFSSRNSNCIYPSSSGVKLVYLPPYSPDLNPLEESFSFVKSWIRRHGLEFRQIVELGDKGEPFLFLYNALEQVKASHAKGWFHNSGYL